MELQIAGGNEGMKTCSFAIDVARILREFAISIIAGEVILKNIEMKNGFNESLSRDGSRKEKRLNGEHWLTLHYKDRSNR